MTIDQPLSIRAVLGSTWALVVRHPLGILIGATGMAAINSAIDIWAPEASSNFVTSITSTGVIYVVFRVLLQKEGLVEREGGFGTYFLASLLVSLGVIGGLVLLIVPGLYLMARWSLATTLVITRDLKAIASLRASWQATKPCAWKLVLLYAVCLVLFVVLLSLVGGAVGVLVVIIHGSADAIDTSVPFVFALNLVVNIGVVASAYLNVAVYRQVIGGDASVEAVFV